MKVGRWTVAGSFILIGLALLMNLWTEKNLFLEMLPWWPLLLVALGIEIIFFYRKRERSPKFDVIGIALLALLIIGGAVYSGVQGFASTFSFDDGVFDNLSLLDGDWEEHAVDPVTIPVDGQSDLTIKNQNGRINVTSYDGKDIVIEPTLLTSRKRQDDADQVKKFDYTVDKTAETISLAVDEGRTIGFGFTSRERLRLVKLDVKVPASFSVDLKSDNGEINVRDLKGDVSVDTDNGKISVNDIGGDAILKSDNGLVKAIKMKGSVEVRTHNGMIHVEDANKNVSARTDTGKVFIKSPQLSGDWDAQTDLGMIEVIVPETASASFRAETDIGSTSSEFPLTKNSDDVVGGISTGAIGDGTYQVQLKTDAGSIAINKYTE